MYATTNGLSRESLPIQQEFVLLSGLKTSDVKIIAIEEAKKLVEGRMDKLAEFEKGVEYYFKYSPNLNNEITLYCALDLIELMGKDELWVRTYEYGVKKKIKPRESLVRKYEELKTPK